MDAWETFQLYSSLKLHFESDGYDAFKYNFKTSVRQRNFDKRNDRFFFTKLGKKFATKQELIEFLVANFRSGTRQWVGALLANEADDQYQAWVKGRDSMGYLFGQEIDRLANAVEERGAKFDDLFRGTSSGSYPLIVQVYLAGQISLETLTIMDILVNFMTRMSVTENIVWPGLSRLVKKYKPFLITQFDHEKARRIILKRFSV